ncbi:hypothetical protein PsorP6_014732 [Peronosclerospora sorghi]|uniref:Uncharacterized protein n=1 Tax=Peronosclerospora sorghi TaxID=230839 RepID=A0ACC0VT01_9STRA|nr:hypothetical protein PsorP6_014732 [Peronosclerospora sorghi]
MKDGSPMRGVKDGSRRLKDELARSIEAVSKGGVDPVLEYRTQRCDEEIPKAISDLRTHFNRCNERVEDLLKAMTHYTNMMHAYAQASAQLMHAISALFESQMQDVQDETNDQISRLKPLAQSSVQHVEEIQQSLQANMFDVAQSVEYRTVVQPMQELRLCNTAITLCAIDSKSLSKTCDQPGKKHACFFV